jgi:hypothetical protein
MQQDGMEQTNSSGFHGGFIDPSRAGYTLAASMKFPVKNLIKALGLVAIGVATAAAGIYIGETDDAPGAALLGILLMIGMVALGWRTARRKP